MGNSSDELGDFAFDGIIADGGGTNKALFTKIGTCKMTVSGAWTCSGNIIVREGELALKQTAALGTGALTVEKNGKLSGITSTKGNMTNSAFTINGTLQVGVAANSVTGVMNFNNKNVTFNSTSVLRLGVRIGATNANTGGASIQNINKLTMNGTVSVFVNEGHRLQHGDEVVLWKCASFAGTPKLESTDIDDVFMWDDSRLSEGILTVVARDPVAIKHVETDSSDDAIYTLDGRRLPADKQLLKHGIYIQRGKKFIVK